MDTKHGYLELNNYTSIATTHDYQELSNYMKISENVPAANEAISKTCSVGKLVDSSWRSKIGFLCLNIVLVIIVSVLTSVAMMYIRERRHEGEIGISSLNGSDLQQGETRDNSKRGQTGSADLPGSEGQQGQMGDQGQMGEKGDQCRKGEKGDQGQKGEKGDQCQKGEKGDQGQKGEKGDQCQRGCAKTCDVRWVSFGKHRYYFGNEKKEWIDAESDCQNKCGHLVKIENAHENEYLKLVAKDQIGDAWIGANDLEKEGLMTWVSDNSPVNTFKDWSPGEPNNHRKEEHCVHLWANKSYQWNDELCSFKFGYICQK